MIWPGGFLSSRRIARSRDLTAGNDMGGTRVKLGPDHPDTLLTSLELAEAYMASGQPLQGRPAGSRLLA